MTLAELLNALFPKGHDTRMDAEGILSGTGSYGVNRTAKVVGVVNQSPLGIEGALTLSGHVLETIRNSPARPIVVLLDGASQRMLRRDEMLGLNEYLGHLNKCFLLAARQGHRTIGVLFGHIAAGAFISTGLAQDTLVAVPGGEPLVMDLPSVAKVTKLPLEKLETLAKNTPVFAPGLAYGPPIGSVTEVWDNGDLAERLIAALERPAGAPDRRDEVGLERKGRLRAAEIAKRVEHEAISANV